MVRTILAYILAFIVPYWFPVLFQAPFLLVIDSTVKYKLAELANFCIYVFSMFAATFFFFWICTKLGVRPVYAMFVFLALAKFSNYRWRIRHAKWVLAQGEVRSTEESISEIYGHLMADIIGFSSALFMRGQLPVY
jgi:hypothetical protein